MSLEHDQQIAQVAPTLNALTELDDENKPTVTIEEIRQLGSQKIRQLAEAIRHMNKDQFPQEKRKLEILKTHIRSIKDRVDLAVSIAANEQDASRKHQLEDVRTSLTALDQALAVNFILPNYGSGPVAVAGSYLDAAGNYTNARMNQLPEGWRGIINVAAIVLVAGATVKLVKRSVNGFWSFVTSVLGGALLAGAAYTGIPWVRHVADDLRRERPTQADAKTEQADKKAENQLAEQRTRTDQSINQFRIAVGLNQLTVPLFIPAIREAITREQGLIAQLPTARQEELKTRMEQLAKYTEELNNAQNPGTPDEQKAKREAEEEAAKKAGPLTPEQMQALRKALESLPVNQNWFPRIPPIMLPLGGRNIAIGPNGLHLWEAGVGWKKIEIRVSTTQGPMTVTNFHRYGSGVQFITERRSGLQGRTFVRPVPMGADFLSEVIPLKQALETGFPFEIDRQLAGFNTRVSVDLVQ